MHYCDECGKWAVTATEWNPTHTTFRRVCEDDMSFSENDPRVMHVGVYMDGADMMGGDA